MKKIILHIGHGKTGTSFIQSCLALSVEKLKEQGINYPYSKSFLKTKEGQISSGNIRPVDNWHLKVEATASASKLDTILFSAEGLFWRQDLLKSVLHFKSKGFEVELILFVRDPAEHVISAYMQAIQTGGQVGTLSEYVDKTYKVPMRVESFVKMMAENDIPIVLRNYSRHKLDILSEISKILKVPDLVLPPRDVINRTMTSAEFELQRLFNEFYGVGSAYFVSNPLCDALPNMKPEKVAFTKDEYQRFYSKFAKSVDAVNALISPKENYTLPKNLTDAAKDSSPDSYVFSGKQLSVLVQSLSTQLLHAENLVKTIQKATTPAHTVTKKALDGIRLEEDDIRYLLNLMEIILPTGRIIKTQIQTLETEGVPKPALSSLTATSNIDAEAIVLVGILEKFARCQKLDGDDLSQFAKFLGKLGFSDAELLGRVEALDKNIKAIGAIDLVGVEKLEDIAKTLRNNATGPLLVGANAEKLAAKIASLEEVLGASESELTASLQIKSKLTRQLADANALIKAKDAELSASQEKLKRAEKAQAVGSTTL